MGYNWRSTPGSLVALARVAQCQRGGARRASAPQPEVTVVPLRILVVDDNEAVRSLLVALLAADGHSVRSVACGRDALALLGDRSAPDPVALLVTDVEMPDMDGFALAVEVRARRPDLPILFVSGARDPRLACLAAHRIAGRFLAKPFDAADLRAAVRAAMS
jgi:two-component system, cell cycle response regulator CpdR